MNRKQKRRKKTKLFQEQDGLCWYCKTEMILIFESPKPKVPSPLNMATFEHLDDRFNQERGSHTGKRRIVLACNQCNHAQGKQRQAEQPIKELHRRSNHI